MKKFKVVITDFINGSVEPEKHILGENTEVLAVNAFSEDQLLGKVEDADALIIYHNISVSKDTISRLTNCKLIIRAGVGIDNVDHAFARTMGIPVANIPDYGSEDVADSAIGLMLTLMRGIHQLNSRLRAGLGEWSYTQVQPLARLRNCPLGIVGLGRIGTAAALRAKALGMDVAFYDPLKPDGYDKALGILRMDTLRSLLERSQVVSLHCPLTAETHHILNAETINFMPMHSYLVNTARGAVIDTKAISAAIENGRLAGAGIDVLEQEPPVEDVLVQAWQNPNHPAFHKVIINPHSAFYSEEGLQEIRVRSAQACKLAFEGLPLRNIVN